MKKKLAIILSGGTMTCSYSAGYLRALAEEYNLTKPDIVIAGSGSAGTAAYYIAGQYKDVTKIWADYLPSKRFLNAWRFWRVVDIDYLIDVVFKKLAPLNSGRVEKSNIQLYIPALNFKTGRVRYFTNDDKQDIFEILRATKAMPLLYGKKVLIDGKLYCDSRISSSAEANLARAIQCGATHIIVIANNNPGPATKIFYGLWLMMRGKKFNKTYRSQLKHDKECPQDNIKLLHIRPENLELKGLDNDKKLLRRTILRGHDDCINNHDLRLFLDEYYGK